MYNRRKVLLALIEIFGGKVATTDYYKLMFLLCQRTDQHHYDFFPYKFGAYSFLLQQDKHRLTDLGHLKSGEGFEISSSSSHSFFNQLDVFTQNELRSLHAEFSKSRGEALLRRVYLEYPDYAVRSLVAQKILDEKEYELVNQSHEESTCPCLFTIGYEGISIDRYLNYLITQDIAMLVDVRKNPISRKYGFSKKQLERYTELVGVSYIHLPELGIPSSLRKDLDTAQAYKDLFEHYKEKILPEQIIVLDRLREIIYDYKRVALTCFEAEYSSCHRSKIVEYFQSDNEFTTPVQHL